MDIYAAAANGGLASQNQPLATPCSGEACKPPPTSTAADQTPGSSSLSGPGNLTPSEAPVPKPKQLTRAQLLAKALRTCLKKPKRQRPSCIAHARKLYGVRTVKKATKRSRRGTR